MENLQFQYHQRSSLACIVLLLFALAVGCSEPGSESDNSITVEKLHQVTSSDHDILLLDVRTRRECLEGHPASTDLRVP
jgi:hypothetical protein